jgi:uridine kinase
MALLENHLHVTLDELEENLSMFKLADYIRECEADFDSRVEAVADQIASNHGIRAIFISGPSGSGKTTLNSKLAKSLGNRGIHAVNISLDDYYFSHEFETDEYGRFDYESISTLDTKLISSHIKELISGRTVRVPTFDFMSKSRVESRAKETQLHEDGILLVEGLHGLAGQIAGSLPSEQWLGIFIMPYATLTDDYTLLDRRDLRILRRTVRDALNRGANALSTIDYWPMLDKAEISSFPEYLANADIYINSAMPYEFYCVAPLAKRLIEDAIFDYRHKKIRNSRLNKSGNFAQIDLALETAYRLHAAVSKIPGISADLVPEDSLLNEFIRKQSHD